MSTRVLLATLLSLLLGGCGGAKASVEAAKRAQGEQASIEVSLDRLDDITAVQGQLDDYLFRSPISVGAPWIERVKVVPPDQANQIVAQARQARPYDRYPGAQVPPIKVLRVYNDGVIPEATAFVGNHMNFLGALDGLGVPEGSKISNKYEGVKANHVEIAQTKGQIEGLEAEADLDSTPDRRKAVIAAQVESLGSQLEQLETRNETAETALFQEIDALAARGMLGADVQPLASSLFFLTQHLARMEEEVLITARLVGIQLLKALPHLPQELQTLAQGLVKDVVADLGQQASNAQNAQVSVSLDGGQLYVSVSGLQQVDPGVVQQSLTARLVAIKDQVVGAPTAAAIGANIAAFEHKFLSSLAEALAKNTGNTYSGALTFSVPGAVGGAAGGFALGGPAPAPGPGAQPGMGPGAQPGMGPGAQPGMGPGMQPGTQPGAQPGMPPGAQPGAPVPGPGPIPPAGPPPAPGGPTPPVADPVVPPPPPTAGGCPPALCNGAVDGDGFAQVKLGMEGRQAAGLLQRRIAPKPDDQHAFPTDDIDGILITFCENKVCRLEATVNPPATKKGLGVGSDLSKVAKKYGQSKCQPVDASRFAVEFQDLPGVYWISDKLDCEGIEDLDFWDRPCKGTVTSIIIGKPQ